MKSNDKSLDLVTNWAIECKLSNEEFEDYSQAITMFSKISKDGTHVILYEIKRNRLDGSTVKKTPLLNSKKDNKATSSKRVIYGRPKDNSDNHPKNKNKYRGFKARIFLLIIVLLAFIIIMFFMNSIGGESSSVTSIHNFTLFDAENSN